MKKKELFYALVCKQTGICAAFVSRKEAREFNRYSGLIFCPCKHKIKKAKIIILK